MTIDERKVQHHQTKVILLLTPKTRRFEDMYVCVCAFSQKNPTETKIRWLKIVGRLLQRKHPLILHAHRSTT